MKVMEIRDAWDYGHLLPGTRPEPRPGANQVVLRMKAASLNWRDYLMITRGYGNRSGELPLIPLSDGVGEVVETGPGVTRVAVGDRAIPIYNQFWISGPHRTEHWGGRLGGPLDGVMQELMLLPEAGVVKAPPHLTDVEAATFSVDAQTAWNALVRRGRIKAGDWVVVQGTGGVATYALLFAKMHGAVAVVTSSSDDKLERVRAMGADHLINYREVPQWGKRVLELTDGRGAEHVLDIGGAGTIEQSSRAVADSGVISLIGNLEGSVATFNLFHIFFKAVRLEGISAGNREMLEEAARAMTVAGLRPAVDDRVYGFEELGTALQALPKRAHFGNICIDFGA